MANYTPITVAIDGPAGAGKSTVAKAVAKALGFTLVDTGAIYRTVALLAKRQGLNWHDDAALGAIVQNLDIRFRLDGDSNRVFVGDEEITALIRTPDIDQGASQVSSRPGVRAGLLALQRRLAGAGGAVMEGRDIGTVVCPDAPVKIFLDASLEERARRRFEELVSRGESPDFKTLYDQVHARDLRDRNRQHAPLKVADDAILLDCTKLSADAVVQRIVDVVAAAQSS